MNAAADYSSTFRPQSGWHTCAGYLKYMMEPITDDIAERAGQFGDKFPGDSADRLIAATALVRGVPLLTHDSNLKGIEHLRVIW